MRLRISTASGSERASRWVALATARGTDPASLPIHAIANWPIYRARQRRGRPACLPWSGAIANRGRHTGLPLRCRAANPDLGASGI